jgi:hypothetical protein
VHRCQGNKNCTSTACTPSSCKRSAAFARHCSKRLAPSASLPRSTYKCMVHVWVKQCTILVHCGRRPESTSMHRQEANNVAMTSCLLYRALTGAHSCWSPTSLALHCIGSHRLSSKTFCNADRKRRLFSAATLPCASRITFQTLSGRGDCVVPGSTHQPEHAIWCAKPERIHVSIRHVLPNHVCRLMLAGAHHLVLVIAIPFAIEFLRSV